MLILIYFLFQALINVVIQIAIIYLAFYLYFTNIFVFDFVNQKIKYFFKFLLYKMTKTSSLIDFLREKFLNYHNFITNSSFKPKHIKITKHLNDIQDLELCIAMQSLSKSYHDFADKDKKTFDVEKYFTKFINDLKINPNDINSEDEKKFKRYHQMFFETFINYGVQKK